MNIYDEPDYGSPSVAPLTQGNIYDDPDTATNALPQYEPEWEFRPLDRFTKGFKEIGATLTAMAGLGSDIVGAEDARDFFITSATDQFKSIENEYWDLANTSFKDSMSSPMDFIKFNMELLPSMLPDLVAAVATGGATAAGSVARFGSKEATLAFFKTVAKKSLTESLEYQTKKNATLAVGKQLTQDQMQKAAVKSMLGQIGGATGQAAYTASRGSGSAYLKDVEARGVDEASPFGALAVGTAQGAIQMALSPIAKSISSSFGQKMATATGKKEIAKMTIGEMTEEAAQYIPEVIQDVAIDPNMTMEEAFSNPETAWALAENAWGGGVLGLLFGMGKVGLSPKAKEKVALDDTLEEGGLDDASLEEALTTKPMTAEAEAQGDILDEMAGISGQELAASQAVTQANLRGVIEPTEAAFNRGQLRQETTAAVEEYTPDTPLGDIRMFKPETAEESAGVFQTTPMTESQGQAEARVKRQAELEEAFNTGDFTAAKEKVVSELAQENPEASPEEVEQTFQAAFTKPIIATLLNDVNPNVPVRFVEQTITEIEKATSPEEITQIVTDHSAGKALPRVITGISADITELTKKPIEAPAETLATQPIPEVTQETTPATVTPIPAEQVTPVTQGAFKDLTAQPTYQTTEGGIADVNDTSISPEDAIIQQEELAQVPEIDVETVIAETQAATDNILTRAIIEGDQETISSQLAKGLQKNRKSVFDAAKAEAESLGVGTGISEFIQSNLDEAYDINFKREGTAKGNQVAWTRDIDTLYTGTLAGDQYMISEMTANKKGDQWNAMKKVGGEWVSEGIYETANEAKAALDTQFTTRATPELDTTEATRNATDLAKELTKSKNPVVAALARAISSKTGLGDIEVLDEAAANYYHTKINRISIKAESGDIVKLHELIHAVTARELKKHKASQNVINAIRKELKESWLADGTLTQEDIDSFANDTYEGDNIEQLYALSSMYEFVAVGLTSKVVMDKLKTMDVNQPTPRVKTLWDKIIGIVGKALGLSPLQYTQLDRLLATFADLVEQAPVEVEGKGTMYEYTPTIATAQKSDSRKEIYDLGMKEAEVGNRLTTSFESFKEGGGKLAKDLLKPIMMELENIDKPTAVKLNSAEFAKQRAEAEWRRESAEYAKGFKDMSQGDKLVIQYALQNSDVKMRDQVLKDNKLEAAWKKVQKVLDEMQEKALKVGMIHKVLPNFYPSRVMDMDGFLGYFHNDLEADNFGAFDYIIKIKEKAEGRKLNEAERAQIMADALTTGAYGNIPMPTSSKHRTVHHVPKEALHVYADPLLALDKHIEEMSEAIAFSELFGHSRRKSIMSELDRIQKRLTKAEGNPEEEQKITEEFNAKRDELKSAEDDLMDSVSNSLTHIKDGKKREDAKELIRARVKQKGVSGILGNLRDISYISLIGNYLSAMVQLADQAVTFLDFGPRVMFKGYSSIFKHYAETGKKLEFTNYFDMAKSTTEFSNSSTSKLLESAMRLSGLKGMDLLGKEISMQSAYVKWSEVAKAGDFKKFSEKWEGKLKNVEGTFKDLQEGKKSEDVLFMLFAHLADRQPITLSQMSKAYLLGGNKRVFWMLKSFQLMFLSMSINEATTLWKKKKYKEAVARTVGLFLLMSMAGAGTDELKSWLTGKDEPFRDNTVDNFWKLIMLNRYTLDKGMESDSLVTSLINGNMPPVRFADDFVSDITALFTDSKEFKFKTLRNMPLAGPVLYARSEAGVTSGLYGSRDRIYSQAKGGTPLSKLRLDIQAHNKRAKELEDKKMVITYDSLRKAIRAEKDKKRRR